jgi:primosomal protein N' (replication factor Y) (superfamily II helicase)
MYINVKLLNGYSQPLTYQVPARLTGQVAIGSLVRVPLRKKHVSAVVTHISHSFSGAFEVKEVEGLEKIPADLSYHAFISRLAAYYQIDAASLLRRVQSFLDQAHNTLDVPIKQNHAVEQSSTFTLTPEQEAIAQQIIAQCDQKTFSPSLLHGVTGSGKTVVYRRIIEEVFAHNGSSILLLPEVTMAVTFEAKFKQWFGNKVFGFHSATSVKEKRALWSALLAGDPVLIIGVHLPVLLPISNLHFIVVDEEHEIGFQEKRHPKINSKEAALLRAQLYNIPILLGSATPSIATLHQVKTKQWNFYQLKNRFQGAFPHITIVPLLDKGRRKQFWLTKQLEVAIADRLSKKEQTIIFINRRGYCFFVQCKTCSYVFSCTNCSVSLTLHTENQSPTLRCHYCTYTQPLPAQCAGCKSNDLIKKGIGTQQVVSLLAEKFPHARIARADLDTTVARKQWQATVTAMEQGTIDILVGTQTITKGYHFPRVTLVGILWADINLNIPMYNATETCLQQLIQVAGRAGRASQTSQVIVQTMAEHPVFQYLNELHYPDFYESEIEHRKLLNYPPCRRLVELELKHEQEDVVDYDAKVLAGQLHKLNAGNLQVLGPTKPPVFKIKNSHSRKIYIKAEQMSAIVSAYQKVVGEKRKSSLFFTSNPLVV